MGDFGPANMLVDRMIARAGTLTLDEAADIYRARVGRLLVDPNSDREALSAARRAAAIAGLEEEYLRARHAATTAFRKALPEGQGPWLVVGQAIANAAGALVVSGVVDQKTFVRLYGPWRDAVGTLTPVGPGQPVASGRRRR